MGLRPVQSNLHLGTCLATVFFNTAQALEGEGCGCLGCYLAFCARLNKDGPVQPSYEQKGCFQGGTSPLQYCLQHLVSLCSTREEGWQRKSFMYRTTQNAKSSGFGPYPAFHGRSEEFLSPKRKGSARRGGRGRGKLTPSRGGHGAKAPGRGRGRGRQSGSKRGVWDDQHTQQQLRDDVERFLDVREALGNRCGGQELLPVAEGGVDAWIWNLVFSKACHFKYHIRGHELWVAQMLAGPVPCVQPQAAHLCPDVMPHDAQHEKNRRGCAHQKAAYCMCNHRLPTGDQLGGASSRSEGLGKVCEAVPA
eukprot:627482-Pelagomonas_calceolata.AAC.4